MKTENTETETAKPVSSMRWFCVSWQVAEVVVVWLAVTGVIGAGNIVKLLAVVNALLAPLVLVGTVVERNPDKRPNWMKHFSTVADFGETFALCWWGWWWCSLGFALGSLVGAAIRYRSGETQNS
jgi:hypothetical protein